MEENRKLHARHIDNHPVGDVNSALPFTRFRKPSNHLLVVAANPQEDGRRRRRRVPGWRRRGQPGTAPGGVVTFV